MGATRRSRPAAEALAAVARALRGVPGPIAVALSGGRDSVALLAACTQCVAADRLVAIHVHHGLSPNADAWSAFCTAFADSLGVDCMVRRVHVPPGDSRGVEAAARAERYAALQAAALERNVATIVLAHHQDDQAETLLLQLARGAGPHGLAAMPPLRDDGKVVWLRPWLDTPRAALEALVRERGLDYVDDESNATTRHRRNALRAGVVPALARMFPGYPSTIARAAAHQAEAARLIDDLAAQDAAALTSNRMLDRSRFAALEDHRARNVLRYFLRLHGLRAPSFARLAAMHAQLRDARPDARVRIAHDGAVVGIHRDRIIVHPDTPRPFEARWQGEAVLVLPHGELAFTPATGEGLAQACLARPVFVRPRAGGERLTLAANRPRRALKSWLQESGVPEWERCALPLVFCDNALAAVPGLGVDVAFAAARGAPGYVIDWRPSGG
jgi:tRNA(Ile)-lysidine synthase